MLVSPCSGLHLLNLISVGIKQTTEVVWSVLALSQDQEAGVMLGICIFQVANLEHDP